jgi:hypothetical protein
MCVTSNFGDLSSSRASNATYGQSIFRASDRARASSAGCSDNGWDGMALQSR